MADMDALRYVQDLLDFHANTVIINAGGIIASYPTNIPGHSLNRYLTGDPLKKVIKACKEALIRVAVRVDFSKVRKEVFEGHQNWAYISPSGEIIDYFGNIHVCFNSDYQQRIAFDIVSEILTYLKPDALFMNMPGYSAGYNYTKGWMSICQCESCRKRFSEMTGKMLPKKEDPGDPDYIAYVRFQQETMAEYQQRLRDLCRQEAPDLLIFQDDMIRIESNTWLEEKERNYPRRAAEQLKLMKGSYPDKEVSVTSVDFIDMKYRYASVSPWQQKIRIAESLANGGFADFYQAGRMDNHPNRSGYAPLREMFAYAAEHEKDYRPAESCADIALVKASGNYFHRMNGNEYLGWYDILTNGHYIFDCIESSVLPVISLEKYKTVILGGVSNTEEGRPVFFDKNAYESDGVIVLNRVKAHTDFRGPYESGLMKMLAIGLGKQYGAERTHADGFGVMHQRVPEYGKAMIRYAPIACGIALTENAYEDTRTGM